MMTDQQLATRNRLRSMGYNTALIGERGQFVWVAIVRKLSSRAPILIRIRPDGTYIDTSKVRDYRRTGKKEAWVN